MHASSVVTFFSTCIHNLALILEQHSACKRAHSGYFQESKSLAKKPKLESISTHFEKMKVSNEGDAQRNRIKDYAVPPNKDTNGFAKTFPQRVSHAIEK